MSALICTIAGSYNPMYRSHMIITVACVYPLFGGFNGYFSARLYTFFNGTDVPKLTLIQTFAFPTFMFIALLAIDLLELMETGETVTIPGVYALLSMTFLFMANAPFLLFGQWVGRDPIKMQVSTKTNRMARDIPQNLPWFTGFKINLIFSSVIPTLVIYYEIQQILSAI